VTEAVWYFDYLSPFAYFQYSRISSWSTNIRVAMRPVLFSGLLNHFGHKGPAEIPSKRRFVYRFFKWQAAKRGIPFNMPQVHPFNPLPPLRLTIAAGSDARAVGIVFDFIYGRGRNAEGSALAELGEELGLNNVETHLADPNVKAQLRKNTEDAIAAGVFGVPTFVLNGELFWGEDATDMFLEYLASPNLFEDEEMIRLSTMPMGLLRAGQ
jgi:2-hydroxychromene-2-carboxylate isomerase